MPDLSTLLEEAQAHLDLLNTIKYAGASLTYVLLDVLDTLSDEISLVWPSRISAMKAIFLVNRYMPIVDVSLGNVVILGVRTHQSCSVMWPLVVALYPLGSFISEIILMVRTVALWNFSRIIVGIMVLNTLIIVVPTVAVVQQYLQTLHYPSTTILEVTDCVASISDGVGWVFYACIIISETTAAQSSGISWDEFNKRSQLAFERPPFDIEEDSLVTLSDLER
ncbi:hypothetical protein TRAPUB_1342 [Trametes pubescens]|uniref:DUF6533 domain-containing protein n=1 Tax=Trametes pubescens TaxID=154538 RepID=A0A1M2VJK0_TRAPU|nr:hypothetical protein TRAPUB_1342 [Trametes pubescens]